MPVLTNLNVGSRSLLKSIPFSSISTPRVPAAIVLSSACSSGKENEHHSGADVHWQGFVRPGRILDRESRDADEQRKEATTAFIFMGRGSKRIYFLV